MRFKLTPGLRQGIVDNNHDERTGTTNITLEFHDVAEPVTIALDGDMPAPLRGSRTTVFGSLLAPEDTTATESIVANLRAHSVGTVARCTFDDDHGFELYWRDPRGEMIGTFRATYGVRREG